MTYLTTKENNEVYQMISTRSLFLEIKQLKERIRILENEKAEYKDIERLEKLMRGYKNGKSSR